MSEILTMMRRGMARGRNGWFCPTRADVSTINFNYVVPGEDEFTPSPGVRIAITSSRRGNTEPIILYLNAEDAEALAKKILETAAEAKQKIK